LEVGLEGEEGGVGVDLWEDEGDGGGLGGMIWCHSEREGRSSRMVRVATDLRAPAYFKDLLPLVF